MTEVISAALGAVGGGLLTFFTTRWQIRKELEFAYDKDLRERRIKVYIELWKLLEVFAKYSRPIDQVQLKDVRELSEGLRHWYFHKGGFYLSIDARDAYFALQETLVAQLREGDSLSTPLPLPAFEGIRELGSALRTSLVADVGARREPALETE